MKLRNDPSFPKAFLSIENTRGVDRPAAAADSATVDMETFGRHRRCDVLHSQCKIKWEWIINNGTSAWCLVMLDDSGRGRGCSGRRKEKSAFNKLIIASLRWTCTCLLKYWHNLLLSTLYHTTASGSRKGCMWCCSLGNYPSAGICTCHEIYSKLQRDPAKINLKAKLPTYFKCELSICISNAFIWIVFMRRASLLTHKHLSSGDRQLSLSINTSQASPYCLWTLLHPSPIRPRDFETEANSLAEVEEEPFKD